MSKNNIVKKFKWIWGWQDDAEEQWLRQMSLSGLHLCSVAFAGVYFFEKGPHHDYIYRLDYRPGIEKTDSSYLQLFKDAGWEHVAELSAWHYFRCEPQHCGSTEIFTDVDSKASKYERLLMTLLVVAPINIFLLPLLLWKMQMPGVAFGFMIFGMAFLLLYVVAFIKLIQKIKRIKRING